LIALYIDLLQPDTIIESACDPIYQFESPYIETLCAYVVFGDHIPLLCTSSFIISSRGISPSRQTYIDCHGTYTVSHPRSPLVGPISCRSDADQNEAGERLPHAGWLTYLTAIVLLLRYSRSKCMIPMLTPATEVALKASPYFPP
jgi:hypothetical protein